ncbi:MAG TPA: helix-turn-helix transcriptional regulator, partial [Pseudonocardiaceae bacterium]|nr:helix-turn-helix transcriptional regulator [Pseudonocardiaceae bacterium]
MAAPTRAKRKLGIFLAEMRDQSGLTATEAAKELLTNQSNISRYEVGGVMPLWATVAMLMNLYGASEEEHATAKKLWEHAHDEPRPVRLPAGTPKSFRKLIAAEAEADSERI